MEMRFSVHTPAPMVRLCPSTTGNRTARSIFASSFGLTRIAVLGSPLKIRPFSATIKASGLAARHNAMVKGERQTGSTPSHHRSALMCHHEGGNPAGTDDRHLWRYKPRDLAKRPADHAEIRQRDGCPPKFFRWNRSGRSRRPASLSSPGSQVPYVRAPGGRCASTGHD